MKATNPTNANTPVSAEQTAEHIMALDSPSESHIL